MGTDWVLEESGQNASALLARAMNPNSTDTIPNLVIEALGEDSAKIGGEIIYRPGLSAFFRPLFKAPSEEEVEKYRDLETAAATLDEIWREEEAQAEQDYAAETVESDASDSLAEVGEHQVHCNGANHILRIHQATLHKIGSIEDIASGSQPVEFDSCWLWIPNRGFTCRTATIRAELYYRENTYQVERVDIFNRSTDELLETILNCQGEF